MINLKRLLLGATACAHLFATVPALAAKDGSAPKPKLALSLHDDTCLPTNATKQAAPFLLFLLSVFAEPVAKMAISGVAGALKKAGEDKIWKRTNEIPSYFYKVDLPRKSGAMTKIEPRAKCLTIIYGTPAPPKDKDGNDLTFEAFAASLNAFFDNDPSVAKTIFSEAEVEFPQGFAEGAAYIFYADLPTSTDHTAFQIRPRFAIVRDGLNPKLSKRKPRDIVVTLSFYEPAAGNDGKVFATRSFNIKNAPRDFKKIDLSDLPSSWIPYPAISAASKSRLDRHSSLLDDLMENIELSAKLDREIGDASPGSAHKEKVAQKQKADEAIARLTDGEGPIRQELKLLGLEGDGDGCANGAASGCMNAGKVNVHPFMARAELRETQDGDKFLQTLGTLLDDQKDTIAKKAADFVNPETRATAAETAATEEDTLRIAAIEAVSAFQASKADPDKTDAEKRVLEIKAAAACRKLRSKRYEDVVCASI